MAAVSGELWPVTERTLRYNAKTTISTRSPAYFEHSHYLFRTPNAPVDPAHETKVVLPRTDTLYLDTPVIYPCNNPCLAMMPTVQVVACLPQPVTRARLSRASTAVTSAIESLHWHIHTHSANVNRYNHTKLSLHDSNQALCFNFENLKAALERLQLGRSTIVDLALLEEIQRVNGLKNICIIQKPGAPS